MRPAPWKGSNFMTSKHMAKVAAYGQICGCVVCGEPYAHVHHLLEGRTPGRKNSDWLTIPLCYECHQGTHGIHGTRQRWGLHKASEMKALAKTLEAIYGNT